MWTIIKIYKDERHKKREEKQRKFINQFALLDHTRFMRTLC